MKNEYGASDLKFTKLFDGALVFTTAFIIYALAFVAMIFLSTFVAIPVNIASLIAVIPATVLCGVVVNAEIKAMKKELEQKEIEYSEINAEIRREKLSVLAPLEERQKLIIKESEKESYFIPTKEEWFDNVEILDYSKLEQSSDTYVDYPLVDKPRCKRKTLIPQKKKNS